MSNTTVLPLQPADHDCPAWCAREPQAEATGSHISTPVALAAPGGLEPTLEVPLLSVQLALGHDEQSRGELPRLWLTGVDDAAELGILALSELIDGLERFALRLRGLRHRYATVITGGAAESVDARTSPTHPLELVAPCPPWCQFRSSGDDHTPTRLLADHFHATEEDSINLGLHRKERTQYGDEPKTVDVVMEHMPYAQWPQIGLTLGTSKRHQHVSLTFDEAGRLRSMLAEYLAQGHEYAQPQAVPSVQELVDYCGARIVEHEVHDPDFRGHAVGDTRNGGPVWITLPRGASGPYRDEEVAHLLAEVHESQHELTAQDRTEAHRAGGIPPRGPWPWTVTQNAA
ncbi:hypothetical protein AB0O76_12425 [Streptomyces sp. NPDC086554]|uniref:DUF6907 domain-containing protein n=1 Tax=Streptomyces sp. NPDC086554 TaxID=3154864 RepID=UPI003418BE8C